MVHPTEGDTQQGGGMVLVGIQMEHLALIEALIQMNSLVLAIRQTRERGIDL